MTISIREYEPLNWLVCSLFTDELLDVDRPKSVLLQVVEKELRGDTDTYALMEDFIKENAKAKELFDLCETAKKDGKLSRPEIKLDEWGNEIGSIYNAEHIKAAEFYLFAESEGYQIPQIIIDDIKFAVERHMFDIQAQENYDRTFPLITREQFLNKAKEPLWTVGNGILYMHGHRYIYDGRSEDTAKMPGFITLDRFMFRTKSAEKLQQFVGDAAQSGQIEINNSDDDLLSAKLKPVDLIEFAKNLPLDLPMLGNNTTDKGRPAYATADMLLMYDAVEKFWSDYDLDAPNKNTAPYKKDVVEWLMDEAEKRNIADFSETRAKMMDTIMRCPKARSGGNTL